MFWFWLGTNLHEPRKGSFCESSWMRGKSMHCLLYKNSLSASFWLPKKCHKVLCKCWILAYRLWKKFPTARQNDVSEYFKYLASKLFKIWRPNPNNAIHTMFATPQTKGCGTSIQNHIKLRSPEAYVIACSYLSWSFFLEDRRLKASLEDKWQS
jgi:hypothetical protein